MVGSTQRWYGYVIDGDDPAPGGKQSARHRTAETAGRAGHDDDVSLVIRVHGRRGYARVAVAAYFARSSFQRRPFSRESAAYSSGNT